MTSLNSLNPSYNLQPGNLLDPSYNLQPGNPLDLFDPQPGNLLDPSHNLLSGSQFPGSADLWDLQRSSVEGRPLNVEDIEMLDDEVAKMLLIEDGQLQRLYESLGLERSPVLDVIAHKTNTVMQQYQQNPAAQMTLETSQKPVENSKTQNNGGALRQDQRHSIQYCEFVKTLNMDKLRQEADAEQLLKDNKPKYHGQYGSSLDPDYRKRYYQHNKAKVSERYQKKKQAKIARLERDKARYLKRAQNKRKGE